MPCAGAVGPYLSSLTSFEKVKSLTILRLDLICETSFLKMDLMTERSLVLMRVLRSVDIVLQTRSMESLLTHYSPFPSYFGSPPKVSYLLP